MWGQPAGRRLRLGPAGAVTWMGGMGWLAAVRIGRDQFKQAGRLLAACALAGGGAWLAGLPEGYWAVITAVVVM